MTPSDPLPAATEDELREALEAAIERAALARSTSVWKVSEPGMAYEHVAACSDYAACRARVEAQGDIWPVLESKERVA